MEEFEPDETKIAEWIKQGESFIFPERLEEWKSCVEARANGMFNGRDLDTSLEIIEKLNNGATLEEAKQLLDSQNHSRSSYAMVSQIVFAFSKQGPEFLEYVMEGNVSPEARIAIETKRRENIKLSLAQTKHTDSVAEPLQEDDVTEKPAEEPLPNDNKYLQVRKENIFTKIVNFIRNFFFSKKFRKDADNIEV